MSELTPLDPAETSLSGSELDSSNQSFATSSGPSTASPGTPAVTPSGASAGKASRFVPLLLWATALYAVVRMLAMFRFSVDVPYWDQWNFVDFLRDAKDGVSWGEVWAPHNEHRVLIPNLVLLGLARLTHWNVRAEIALVHALIGLRFAIVALVVFLIGRKTKLSTWTCIPILAAFLCTRAQAENLMWGWQVTLTLGALFTLLCCLALVNGGWPRFGLATVLALASQFSFASGVVLWPIGAFFIAIQTKLSVRVRLIRMSIWVLVGGVATFFYNRGLPRSPKTQAITLSGMVHYVVMFIGSSLAPLRTVPAETIAWQAGLVGLGLFALGIIGVGVTRQFTRWLPIIMWGLTAPATAVITAYGRLGFVPANQSMSSRYVTMSVTLWASTAALLTATVLHLFRNRSWRAVRVFGSVAVSVVAIAVVTVAGPWDRWARDRGAESLRNRAYLAEDAQLTTEHKAQMFPDPGMIDRERPFLIAERLTQFRNRVPKTTVPVPTSVTPTTSIAPTSITPTTSAPVTTSGGPTTSAPTTTSAPVTTTSPTSVPITVAPSAP